MIDEIKIREAMHLVWRNLPQGVSTFSECKCGRGNGRGGGPCLECAQERLAALISPLFAEQYVVAVRAVRQLEALALEEIE